MIKEKTFLRDIIITKLLKAEECREYLASIIAAVLKIEKNYVMENLRLLDTEVSQNIHNKDQEVDVIVENNEMIINIEINTVNTRQSRIKNNTYIAQLILRQTAPGKIYNIKPIVQINVDCFDVYMKNEFIYHSVMMEEKYHIKRNESYIDIYDINLDFLTQIDYNQIKKLSEKDLKWLLYIFVCQDDRLKKNLYSENGMMKKVEKKMKNFMRELDSILYYNHEEFRAAELEELKEEAVRIAKEEAYKKGRNEGIKQNAIEIAKKMLSKDKDLNEIHEFTNLTIKEIQKLQESLS